jgi:hypothetical protein
MNDRERYRGDVQVQLLDLTPIEAQVTAWAHEHLDGFPADAHMEFSFKPWGLIYSPDGTPMLVCNEGVGFDFPTRLDAYRRADDSFGIVPEVGVPVPSVDRLTEHLTGESVDLVDFVRRFGARLEQNFHELWDYAHRGVRSNA